MKKSTPVKSHHCTVLEQRRLVSRMTRCDRRHNQEDAYACYLKATRESRSHKACMYS